MQGRIIFRDGRPIVRFGRSVYKRCKSLQEAERFLTGLRFKSDEGTFDVRDYRKDQPLGFKNLAKGFISRKKAQGKRSWKKMEYHLNYAISYFDNQNIKEIGEGELEDFFLQLPSHLSGKTRYNIRATLHTLWRDAQRRERKRNPSFQIPEFPECSFDSPKRKIVDKDTQWLILEKLREITPHNPKIYLACMWLATYTNTRPIELINIKEGDIDRETGVVTVSRSKTGVAKEFYLTPEDLEIVRSMPRGLPHLYFFRHEGGKGVQPGQQFGPDILRKWWTKACQQVGVEGVSHYPGTRHSSLTDINRRFGYARAKQASGNRTNRALERYLIATEEELRELYVAARPVPAQNEQGKIGKLLEFKK